MSLNPAYLYKLVNGESAFFYTNVGSEQDFNGDTYLPTLISHTGPSITQDIAKANVEINVPFDNDIAILYTPFIPPSETEVYIYKAYLGVTAFELHWQGRISRGVEFDGPWAKLLCDTTLSGLQTEFIPETHQNLCNYFLGDGRCPVNLAAHRLSVTVDSVDADTDTGQPSLEVTGIVLADGWYTGGTVQASNGDFRFIVNHTGDILTLDNPFPAETVAVTDTVDIYPGCDRLFTTCDNKFGAETGSGAAFGGNPIMPNKNPHEYGRML